MSAVAGRRFFFEHKGQKVEVVDAEVRLGAAPDATIVVSGKGVEPLVAVARREGDGVVLESRARENEAKVNGRLLSVADLAPGAKLKLGDVEMRVAGAGVDLRLESDEGTFPIKVGANLIGRLADAAVMVDNPTVSRKHALVFLLPNGQARIRHLGAQNGTWVDGVRLGQVELSQGDKIEIGDDHLFFFASAPVAAAAPPEAAAPPAASPPIEPEPGGPPPPDATVIAGALPPLPPPVAAAAPPEGPRFELILGDETHVLGPGTFVVGRTPECDLSLPGDALVSRRHTQITVEGDTVRLRDLDSSNGTRVNGHRVEREITLADGDRVGIGGAEIVFHAVRPPDPYAATVLGVPAPAPAFYKTMLAGELGAAGA
ncbi:MAG TPA: FHA domain-containing protein, partial [Thermoanaerobaculia bacterium]|nr:FHA domain-containing protein [Thermoanaerobaculia bacterium]